MSKPECQVVIFEGGASVAQSLQTARSDHDANHLLCQGPYETLAAFQARVLERLVQLQATGKLRRVVYVAEDAASGHRADRSSHLRQLVRMLDGEGAAFELVGVSTPFDVLPMLEDLTRFANVGVEVGVKQTNARNRSTAMTAAPISTPSLEASSPNTADRNQTGLPRHLMGSAGQPLAIGSAS